MVKWKIWYYYVWRCNSKELVLQGCINSALRLLEKSESTGVLPLNQRVTYDLITKYSRSKPADSEALVDREV